MELILKFITHILLYQHLHSNISIAHGFNRGIMEKRKSTSRTIGSYRKLSEL
ncbi:hypothetical protein [Peijinzhouia sedimentorum]